MPRLQLSSETAFRSPPLCETTDMPPLTAWVEMSVMVAAKRYCRLATPMQFGPATAMFAEHASAASFRCRSQPSSVAASAKPSEITKAAGMPSSQASVRTPRTPAAGTDTTTQSGTSGNSWSDWSPFTPPISERLGLTGQIGYSKFCAWPDSRILAPAPLCADTPTSAIDRGRSRALIGQGRVVSSIFGPLRSIDDAEARQCESFGRVILLDDFHFLPNVVDILGLLVPD